MTISRDVVHLSQIISNQPLMHEGLLSIYEFHQLGTRNTDKAYGIMVISQELIIVVILVLYDGLVRAVKSGKNCLLYDLHLHLVDMVNSYKLVVDDEMGVYGIVRMMIDIDE